MRSNEVHVTVVQPMTDRTKILAMETLAKLLARNDGYEAVNIKTTLHRSKDREQA